jgi:hypothetical protein
MTEKRAAPSNKMNEWVKSLVEKTGLSGPDAAEILRRDVGEGYNRFTLYKMTKNRRVTLLEAQALSNATGFPLPDQERSALSYDQRRSVLSPKRQAALDQVLEDLEAAEAIEKAVGRSTDDSQGGAA